MHERVEKLRGELGEVLASLDAASVPLPEVPSLWTSFDALERVAGAAKVLLAGRVAESGVWKRGGYRSAAEWMAAREGCGIGVARAVLDTCERLEKLPSTEAALREGKLSRRQVEAVADGAAANPGAEDKLLGVAATGSLGELREEALRAKAAADPDPDATHARIRRGRGMRWYVGPDGSWRFSGGGPNDAGAVVAGALESIISELFEAARARGEREPRSAYAFDALVELARRLGCEWEQKPEGGENEEGAACPGSDAAGDGPPAAAKRRPAPQPKYLAILKLDWTALLRGSVQDEECCEIAGLGPVPVSVARELLGESVLKLVLTKGVDVANVTHLGRGANAAQKVALLWSQPRCSVAGCDHTRVQNDHRIPYATSRHTRLDELDPLCTHHHRLKTDHGWELVAGKGKRALVAPDDPRHPNRARASPSTRPPPEEREPPGEPPPSGREHAA